MAERIDVPPTLMGDNETKLRQIWRYLFNTSETLNRALQNIGGIELTDRERAAVQGIMQEDSGLDDVSSLKELMVQTAEYVKKEINSLQNYVNSAILRAMADRTTAVTDFDNLTDDGNYWINMANMQNGPTGLSTGTYRTEIEITTDIVVQRIWTGSDIYLRMYQANEETPWGEWYRFSGTELT